MTRMPSQSSDSSATTASEPLIGASRPPMFEPAVGLEPGVVGERDVRRGDRLPVVPRRALDQVERVGRAVGADVEAGGRSYRTEPSARDRDQRLGAPVPGELLPERLPGQEPVGQAAFEGAHPDRAAAGCRRRRGRGRRRGACRRARPTPGAPPTPGPARTPRGRRSSRQRRPALRTDLRLRAGRGRRRGLRCGAVRPLGSRAGDRSGSAIVECLLLCQRGAGATRGRGIVLHSDCNIKDLCTVCGRPAYPAPCDVRSRRGPDDS